jgi:hypothetical protein
LGGAEIRRGGGSLLPYVAGSFVPAAAIESLAASGHEKLKKVQSWAA